VPDPIFTEIKRLQTPVRALAMPVFPTLESLQDVIDLAESKLPITTKNELKALLFTYHNSLLRQVELTRNK
jgi:hypothetical protein